MTDIAGRTVVVTGAASPRGIGRASVARLAADGWNIGIVDRDIDGATELAASLTQAHGVQARAAAADVSDADEVRSAVSALADALPPFFGLVNLAGISAPTPYLEMDDAEWSRVIGINLSGVHYATQAVARHLVDRGEGGRIVSISSVSAQRGGGSYSRTAYSAAKAGILGFTRSVARELGEHGITANAIAPGAIDTDLMGGTLTEERIAALTQDQLISRIGTVTDVAAGISFLLSDDAAWITGQTLNINGGLYMS
jgi:NAD(P)-dependent dehydrogenase (short-subunit alcohol dehydrogenase family)